MVPFQRVESPHPITYGPVEHALKVVLGKGLRFWSGLVSFGSSTTPLESLWPLSKSDTHYKKLKQSWNDGGCPSFWSIPVSLFSWLKEIQVKVYQNRLKMQLLEKFKLFKKFLMIITVVLSQKFLWCHYYKIYHVMKYFIGLQNLKLPWSCLSSNNWSMVNIRESNKGVMTVRNYSFLLANSSHMFIWEL